MKACVLENIGKLVYQDVRMPEITDDEILLHIRACGICSSDINRVFKTGTYHFPTIPGHEFSGDIIKIGRNVPPSYLGKRAVVFPLLPCKECLYCKSGQYQLCENYSYFGSRCDGAYAEYLAVPIWNIILFSDKIPYDVAALCEPASVARHAVQISEIKDSRQSVAIIGSGTIGILVALWLKSMMLSEVVVVGRNVKKQDFVEKLGISYSRLEDIEDKRYDVVFECVGSSHALETSLSLVKKRGTVVCVGNPNNDIILPKIIYWRILRSELTLRGVWNSCYNDVENDWSETLRAIEDKVLNIQPLITHSYPLEKYMNAFQTIMDKSIFSVKVILTND